MTLPLPHSGLRAVIVVPAKDEEELVARCVHGLAAQEGVDHDRYEVILVLDACRDGTRAQALAAAAHHPDLRLHLVEGPGLGVGRARRAGMEAGCARLGSVGRPHGLIACTDADSVVDRCWLAVQLELAAQGAVAIGGRIDILPEDLELLSKRTLDARKLSGARRRMLAAARDAGLADHGYFSGASMSVTASLYREVGGLKPLVALEDESLERTLIERGVAIVRSNTVRVSTSGRIEGRAPRGLAYDLATAL
jgi:glycosyltransferase involved in cell wall biosynthesis